MSESLSSKNHFILPKTLYAFGNRQSPRLPRPDIDIVVVDELVYPTEPITGASSFGDVQFAPLSGHYHKIEAGTRLPSGIAVIADGRDVGGNRAPTHHTIYPNRPMPFTEFQAKFLNCGWVYVGKKAI